MKNFVKKYSIPIKIFNILISFGLVLINFYQFYYKNEGMKMIMGIVWLVYLLVNSYALYKEIKITKQGKTVSELQHE